MGRQDVPVYRILAVEVHPVSSGGTIRQFETGQAVVFGIDELGIAWKKGKQER